MVESLSEEEMFKQLVIAQEAMRGLWRQIKYKDLYINFLSGSYTEEEFDKESEAHIHTNKNDSLDEKTILYACSYLKQILPDVDTIDLAEMIDMDEMKLDDLFTKLIQLQHKKEHVEDLE